MLKVDMSVPLKMILNVKKGNREEKNERGRITETEKENKEESKEIVKENKKTIVRESLKSKSIHKMWRERKRKIYEINLQKENKWRELLLKLKLTENEKEALFDNIMSSIPERENIRNYVSVNEAGNATNCYGINSYKSTLHDKYCATKSTLEKENQSKHLEVGNEAILEKENQYKNLEIIKVDGTKDANDTPVFVEAEVKLNTEALKKKEKKIDEAEN